LLEINYKQAYLRRPKKATYILLYILRVKLPGWRWFQLFKTVSILQYKNCSQKLKKKKMSKLHFTTKHANEATVKHNWYVVDGTNQTVGRMCARIAAVLRGKNKAYYTPHVDCGDFIIVTNCEKVKLTGNKMDEKLYDHYTGYPGGRKEEVAKDLQKRRPEVLIERAVKGMLPKNRLGRQMYKKLFVYQGATHPHGAQQPKELKF
jgi:large subunit ribosomal protein L13